VEENLKSPITTFVCFDIETTGLNPQQDKIIEIGAVKVVNKKIVGIFNELIHPQMKLPAIITSITGINDAMLVNADTLDNVIPRFLEFAGDHIVLGHNIMFDYSFIKKAAAKMNMGFEKTGIDTLELSRYLHRDLESRSLENMCRHYQIHNDHAHRAYDDAKATAMLYVQLCNNFFTEHPDVFRPRELTFKVKKSQPITKKQKNYLIDLLKYHNIDSEQSIDTLTQSEASRWIDQIILSRGRMS
jgi:DNA polymerase-3 subunit alpha (Gram-positive type)